MRVAAGVEEREFELDASPAETMFVLIRQKVTSFKSCISKLNNEYLVGSLIGSLSATTAPSDICLRHKATLISFETVLG